MGAVGGVGGRGGGESQGCVGTMIPLGARVIIPGQCENITLSQKKRGEEGEGEEEGEKNRAISEIDCWKTRTLQKQTAGPRTLIE